jgi:NAD(P)H dehydrogenase (quinone)
MPATTYGVTGATGKLGRLVVDALLDRGVPAADVVALVRTPAKADRLSERGVSVREADYDRPETLGAAVEGVDRLLLVSGDAVGQRVRQHGAVLDAARTTGVQQIAYTSILHADTSTLPLAPEHLATEQLLRESGVAYTLHRNSWYLENYTDQAAQYLEQGEIRGAADGARVAAAPRTDYAAAAAAALVGDGHDGRTYELGGPGFTFPELAEALSEVTGRTVRYRDLSLEEFRSGLLAAGLDEGTAGYVTAREQGTAGGELDAPTEDLERLLGRPATPLVPALRALLG